MQHPLRVLTVLGTITAVLLAGCATTDDAAPAPDRETAETSAPQALADFYDQTITWQACDDVPDYDCGTVTVPMDHTNPGHDSLDIHLTKPSGAMDAPPMLFNPGGPGSSGIAFVQSSLAYVLSDELAAGITPIGFDPRGVGQSEPIRCMTDEEFDADRQLQHDASTPEGWAESEQDTPQLAQQCLERSGDIVRFADTVSAARDMDIIRAALGTDQLDYFGISYGTKLGATYAELYPEQVGKFVLDSVLPPSAASHEVTAAQAAGFEQSLNEWAQWCATEDSCQIGVPNDAASVLDEVEDLIERTTDEPLVYPDGRQQYASDLFYGIVLGLYSPATRENLSIGFQQAINDDFENSEYIPVLLAQADMYMGRGEDGRYDNNMDAFQVINCLDFTSPEKTFEQAQTEAADLAKSAPLIGPAMSYSTGCNGWPFDPVEALEETDAEGSDTIIVTGRTSDPATPIEFSHELAQQLDNSVHITVEGAGHGAYSADNACIVDAIDGYILDDELPADGLVCQ